MNKQIQVYANTGAARRDLNVTTIVTSGDFARLQESIEILQRTIKLIAPSERDGCGRIVTSDTESVVTTMFPVAVEVIYLADALVDLYVGG